jgi:hypothetical protein
LRGALRDPPRRFAAGWEAVAATWKNHFVPGTGCQIEDPCPTAETLFEFAGTCSALPWNSIRRKSCLLRFLIRTYKSPFILAEKAFGVSGLTNKPEADHAFRPTRIGALQLTKCGAMANSRSFYCTKSARSPPMEASHFSQSEIESMGLISISMTQDRKPRWQIGKKSLHESIRTAILTPGAVVSRVMKVVRV